MENLFDILQKLVLEKIHWYQEDTLPNEDWLNVHYASEPMPSRYETVMTYLLLQILSQLFSLDGQISQQQTGMSLEELGFYMEVLANCNPSQAAKEMISKRLAEKGWEYRWDDSNEQYGLFRIPGPLEASPDEMQRAIEEVQQEYDLSDPRWDDNYREEEGSHV